MKKLLLGVCAIFVGFSCLAQKKQWNNKALNDRSDTIDILNYQINLDMTNVANRTISGNCKIQFTPLMNGVTSINLDLRSLTVDSVRYNGNSISHTYNNAVIHVNFPLALNSVDTAELTVYYKGIPKQDPSGWGGFYFVGGYSFNLGVAIQDVPHNYGRIWFPCFDNFVEKSSYEFNITTDSSQVAHCNGQLMNETQMGNTITRQWVLTEQIPTYLACIAVADYETVHQSFNGMNGIIPVELVAVQADTTDMKNSFIHLEDALDAFERSYGAYEWSKIGYSLVPFNAGAMEHATNITFPRYAANGTLNNETLMAHEFAHSWWGNLVTCETSGDMWINEGMASYSEHLFLERVYDRATAMEEIKNNHKSILQFTHHREGGYRAVSGVPTQYTYSSHVYNKGASVAHNMRAYLGDSLFFVGLKAALNAYKFGNMNSAQFRDELTNATGVNMTDFFNDWIFSPGFSHFNVDSIQVIPTGGSYDLNVFIQQKLKGATNFHTNTPLEITFYDSSFIPYHVSVLASGQYSMSTVNIPFNPLFYILNEQNLLNQARTDNQELIKNTFTNRSYDLAMITSFSVNAVVDSALLQMEHHWVAPDSVNNNVNNYQLSNNRYWSFKGYLPSGFRSSMQLNYDGGSANGFLDLDLFANFRDTLILLYREDAGFDWTEYPYYTKTRTAFNKGFLILDSLLLGEYTFGNKKYVVTGIEEEEGGSLESFKLYPNPAENFITVETKQNAELMDLKIYNLRGQIVFEGEHTTDSRIDTKDWRAGSYLLNLSSKEGKFFTRKIIVK